MSGHIDGFGSTPLGGDGDERGRTFTSVHAVERPPTLDYYRNSVRKTDLAKARASLADLTRGRTQTALHETFETYEKRNLQIVESQLKKKPIVETRSESSVSSPPTPPDDTEVSGKKGKKDEGKRKKLGVFEGVFLRVVSNLFGVMLYLRISWVAGQAGIFGGAGVVALGSLVAIVTTLSTSAICTNGQVKGGGSYYLISRSLGPEFGGAIGIIFSIANAVGAAMYVVGFAETVQTLLRNYDVQIVDGGLNDIRIMGLAACVPLICVVFLGTNFESKMQMVLVALFLSSIVDYWVGTFLWGLILPVDSEKAMRGITGYSGTTFNDNLYPNFRDGYNFFTVFAVYFPATTDIMAGANVSGDLQDPQRAIPLGTLSAIVFCSIVYLIMILMTGGTVLRDADGFSMPELHNATLRNQLSPACADNSTCPYGLMNYFQIVELGSGWGPLVTAGIFACTLSSALVSMVSAPKIFQAVCRDKLFPYIDYFATGYGKNDEPRKGYFLTLAIVCAVILIGK
ncbi:CRE-NKCC-1 protein [Aphelenchoides avenae]|nr:CRE-NKCC-1 protein [Aphelenchus avenae]